MRGHERPHRFGRPVRGIDAHTGQRRLVRGGVTFTGQFGGARKYGGEQSSIGCLEGDQQLNRPAARFYRRGPRQRADGFAGDLLQVADADVGHKPTYIYP